MDYGLELHKDSNCIFLYHFILKCLIVNPIDMSMCSNCKYLYVFSYVCGDLMWIIMGLKIKGL
jgi:hypothetical protein